MPTSRARASRGFVTRTVVLSLPRYCFVDRDAWVERQKYYKSFKNRRDFTADAIEAAARKYVQTDIVSAIGRDVVEEFTIELHHDPDPLCQLHVWVFRKN